MTDWTILGLGITVAVAGATGVGALLSMASSFLISYRSVSSEVSDYYYRRFFEGLQNPQQIPPGATHETPAVRALAHLGAVGEHHVGTSVEGSSHLNRAALALLGATVVLSGTLVALGLGWNPPLGAVQLLGAGTSILYGAAAYLVLQFTRTRNAIDSASLRIRRGGV